MSTLRFSINCYNVVIFFISQPNMLTKHEFYENSFINTLYNKFIKLQKEMFCYFI